MHHFQFPESILRAQIF